MAENWHQLGFIVQRPSYGPGPIFIETQRGDIHRKSKIIHPKPHLPEEKEPGVPIPKRGGPLILPVPDSPKHNIDNVHSLRNHLQTAMAIELATIPLYLFGMYSIKIPDQYVNDPRYYDPVIGAIRGQLGLSFCFLLAEIATYHIYNRCGCRGNAAPHSGWEYSSCGRWPSKALRCRLYTVLPLADAWPCS